MKVEMKYYTDLEMTAEAKPGDRVAVTTHRVSFDNISPLTEADRKAAEAWVLGVQADASKRPKLSK